MKRIIPALLLACVLFACNKNSSSDVQSSDGPKYPVRFSVSNFVISMQNMRVESDTSLAKITNIYYFAFGSDNQRKTAITQDTTYDKTGFGIIKDTLPAGTYTIAIFATTSPMTIANATSLTNLLTLGDFDLVKNKWKPLPEIFYKKLQVTVNPSGNVQQDVTLDRITGKISVEAYDALPATDPNGELTLLLSSLTNQFYIQSGNIGANPRIDGWGTRISQTKLDGNVLGGDFFGIHVTYRDKTTGTILVKSFPNITLPANKKIDIKGYLYGVPDTTKGNYSIKVNSSYSGSTSYSLN